MGTPPTRPEDTAVSTITPIDPSIDPYRAGSITRSPHRDWLVGRRNEGATPDEICAELVAVGWDVDTAAATSLQSLRRGDRHSLLYSAVCWGAGLAALGAGSAAHLALTNDRNPLVLASFITLMMVAAPIGVYAGVTARRVEAAEAHAIWSPTRRSLFGLLAGCAATVGLVRLLHYTFNAVAAAVGATGYAFTPSSIVQVMVTLSISIPLFWWSLLEWRRSNVALRSLTTSSLAASEPRTDTLR